jgi:hypothetical protein
MLPRKPQSSKSAFAIIKEIIEMGVVDIPPQFNGTGAPGNTLEYLLNVVQNNFDSPDLKDWEVKFHGGNALLTLFHKDPEPTGIMNQVVDFFGWDDDKGRISFRHTISGKSPLGFVINSVDNRITVNNKRNESIVPYWEHNTILGAIAAKLRRLILVHGKVLNRQVVYNSAVAYWDLDLLSICKAIESGLIYIDFDARTTGCRGTSLRNHGTKFRIHINNIGHIYRHSELIK